MAAVFVPNQDGTYDLQVDHRTREYDVDPEDLMAAVRRARLDPSKVSVEDETGYRVGLTRR
jgi:hypothetical protein